MCLSHQAYKVKVIHREITKMGIPAVIETLEDGIVDPKDIIYSEWWGTDLHFFNEFSRLKFRQNFKQSNLL